MTTKRNEVFTGLSLPLAANRAASGKAAVELTDKDISGMEGINPLYRAMRTTFKDKLGKPHLVGAEVRIALVAKEGEMPYSASQLLEDLLLTAEQLEANAQLEQPLPISQVLSHQGLGNVLNSLSSANRKSGTRLIICTEDGDAEAPVLDASDFIEPARDDVHRQTGSFRITGLYRDDESGEYGFLVMRSRVPVQLPHHDPRWSWPAIKNALDLPTFLVGTIARSGKSSDWMVVEGARLECQEEFKEMRNVETA